MKHGLWVLVMLFSLPVFAQQTVFQDFQKINTQAEAQKFIDSRPELKPTLLKLSAGKDTSLIEKRLLRQNKGDVFSVGYVTYKVLEAAQSVKYRAQYVFLDGGSLSPAQVDSIKKIIVQKANSGVPFAKLSDEYTMDGNTTKGDTDWFFGELMFPKEFQDAVAAHKKDEIFFVDVSDKGWHYIIKKTYDDDLKKDIVVLRANGR
ncbi:peptidylprolyl isomerase [Paraflavitalea pollutisoli]|uniref:peptidylprolyl isomerase n=1 Tax=Paraflavitalea pollutisoli TaxID=3034143 RepID=UPI0023ECA687|nr:peptidylprolyl isomerase [Paraflavitalea sp. H1-2-19X]